MDANDDTLKQEKIIIRSLLTCTQKALTVHQLGCNYVEQEGHEIPFRKFGYKSLFEFLKCIPDTVKLQHLNGSVLVIPIIAKESQHIADMVMKQRRNPRMKGPRRPMVSMVRGRSSPPLRYGRHSSPEFTSNKPNESRPVRPEVRYNENRQQNLHSDTGRKPSVNTSEIYAKDRLHYESGRSSNSQGYSNVEKTMHSRERNTEKDESYYSREQHGRCNSRERGGRFDSRQGNGRSDSKEGSNQHYLTERNREERPSRNTGHSSRASSVQSAKSYVLPTSPQDIAAEKDTSKAMVVQAQEHFKKTNSVIISGKETSSYINQKSQHEFPVFQKSVPRTQEQIEIPHTTVVNSAAQLASNSSVRVSMKQPHLQEEGPLNIPVASDVGPPPFKKVNEESVPHCNNTNKSYTPNRANNLRGQSLFQSGTNYTAYMYTGGVHSQQRQPVFNYFLPHVRPIPFHHLNMHTLSNVQSRPMVDNNPNMYPNLHLPMQNLQLGNPPIPNFNRTNVVSNEQIPVANIGHTTNSNSRLHVNTPIAQTVSHSESTDFNNIITNFKDNSTLSEDKSVTNFQLQDTNNETQNLSSMESQKIESNTVTPQLKDKLVSKTASELVNTMSSLTVSETKSSENCSVQIPSLFKCYQKKLICENAIAESDSRISTLDAEDASMNSLSSNHRIHPKIIEKIGILLNENPEGIWASQLTVAYKLRFNHELDTSGYGYNHVMEMVHDLPNVIECRRPNAYSDIRLFPTNVTVKEEFLIQPRDCEKLKDKIRILLDEYPHGLLSTEFETAFLNMYKQSLNLQGSYYDSVDSLLVALHGDCLNMYATIDKQMKICPINKPGIDTKNDIAIVPNRDINKLYQIFNKKIPANAMKLGDKIKQFTYDDSFKIGKSVPIVWMELNDPFNFFFQFKGLHYSSSFLILQKNLQDHLTTNAINYELHSLHEGLFVCYKGTDDLYLRAQIQKVDGNSCSVNLIDYGTKLSSGKENLYYLPKFCADLPAQAVMGLVHNIKPANNERVWSQNACKAFSRWVKNSTNLYAYITYIGPNEGPVMVDLRDKLSNGEQISLSDYLVRRGFADFNTALQLPENKPHQINYLLKSCDAQVATQKPMRALLQNQRPMHSVKQEICDSVVMEHPQFISSSTTNCTNTQLLPKTLPSGALPTLVPVQNYPLQQDIHYSRAAVPQCASTSMDPYTQNVLSETCQREESTLNDDDCVIIDEIPSKHQTNKRKLHIIERDIQGIAMLLVNHHGKICFFLEEVARKMFNMKDELSYYHLLNGKTNVQYEYAQRNTDPYLFQEIERFNEKYLLGKDVLTLIPLSHILPVKRIIGECSKEFRRIIQENIQRYGPNSDVWFVNFKPETTWNQIYH